jgi:CBS domain-containing protein
MEIKRTLILDSSDFISRALPQLDELPAVIVTKNGRYYGIIDHASLSQGIREPDKTKCETAAVKPPVLMRSTGMLDRIEAFMTGHFRALPVIDGNDNPLGITTRVELLKDMMYDGLIPPMAVTDLMSSPVFTIDEKETLAAAKRLIRENKARRLVVTKNQNIIGVVSAFDIGAWAAKQNLAVGRKNVKHSEPIRIDDMPISSFLRPEVTLVSEGSGLHDAVNRMIDKQVSEVVVVVGRKPVGVLSALDVFRKIQDLAEESMPIQISGLDEDSMHLYEHIKEKIGHVLEKFRGTFNVRNCSVHVKEGKSTFVVNIYFDTDRGHVSLKGERGSLKETVDELAVELGNMLRKKKEIRRLKPRVTHAH